MSVKAIPDGYHTITPYLVVPGAAALIDFLKQAFDARERLRHERPDGAIMHAEVEIGDSVLMLADAVAAAEASTATINLYVADADASYNRAISAGAESLREPADQVFGDRSAGVKDKWGNQWWLATHIEDVSEEELRRRMSAARA